MTKAVLVPFYATVFRADGFEEALDEIAPLSLRYGASSYLVFRSGQDRYKFNAYFMFDDTTAWEAYWYGPEFIEWRERYSSWYQIPILYDLGTIPAMGRSEVAEPSVDAT